MICNFNFSSAIKIKQRLCFWLFPSSSLAVSISQFHFPPTQRSQPLLSLSLLTCLWLMTLQKITFKARLWMCLIAHLLLPNYLRLFSLDMVVLFVDQNNQCSLQYYFLFSNCTRDENKITTTTRVPGCQRVFYFFALSLFFSAFKLNCANLHDNTAATTTTTTTTTTSDNNNNSVLCGISSAPSRSATSIYRSRAHQQTDWLGSDCHCDQNTALQAAQSASALSPAWMHFQREQRLQM